MLNDAVPGSVIYAQHFFTLPGILNYNHYGIYAGNNEVIHFTNEVQSPHKIELKKFISYSGESGCYVRNFPETLTALKIILRNKKIPASQFTIWVLIIANILHFGVKPALKILHKLNF